ncbi:MAG: WYL domain-containing protein, partial [Burkholderiales bacterium]
RQAIRDEVEVDIHYRDAEGIPTGRIIYPLALGYFQDREVLIAWCTLRQDYRQFRIDRIDSLELRTARLPEPRRTLFHRWQASLNLPDLR